MVAQQDERILFAESDFFKQPFQEAAIAMHVAHRNNALCIAKGNILHTRFHRALSFAAKYSSRSIE